jgi:hypothetical protein
MSNLVVYILLTKKEINNLQMLQADIRRFEDINYGSGDDVSLILDENKLSSDTNDNTSELAVLDPSVCSMVFF